MSLKTVLLLEKFTLEIKAKDFGKEGTIYLDLNNCAVARAAKRQLKVRNATEGVSHIDIENSKGEALVTFLHVDYGEDKFLRDQRKAEKALAKGETETVLRKMVMKRRVD